MDDIINDLRNIKSEIGDLIDRLEKKQKHQELQSKVPDAGWKHIESFYPYYSRTSEMEMDAFLERYKIEYGDNVTSPCGQYRMIFESGNYRLYERRMKVS